MFTHTRRLRWRIARRLSLNALLLVVVRVLLLSQVTPALAVVSRRFAYVPNRDGGRVSMYALDEQSGQLISLGLSHDISGNEPQALAVDPLRRYVYVVNFFQRTYRVLIHYYFDYASAQI